MKSDAIVNHAPHSACDWYTIPTSQAMRGRVAVNGELLELATVLLDWHCSTAEPFHDYCPAPSHYLLDRNDHCSDSVISNADQGLATKGLRIA